MRQALLGAGILWAISLFFTSNAWAGDVASFQNLGFSPDGSRFQFGQYGIDQRTQRPYARIDTVDVAANTFVPGGRFQLSPPATSLGDDGRSALIALLGQAQPLRQRLRIDSLVTGRPIYFRVNGETAESKDIQFIDYQTSLSYNLRLIQTVTGQGPRTRSRFHIEVTIRNEAGQTLKTFRMGNPSFERQGIRDYRIAQVILGPTERQLVVVVERDEWAGGRDSADDWNIRYMVETIRLP